MSILVLCIAFALSPETFSSSCREKYTYVKNLWISFSLEIIFTNRVKFSKCVIYKYSLAVWAFDIYCSFNSFNTLKWKKESLFTTNKKIWILGKFPYLFYKFLRQELTAFFFISVFKKKRRMKLTVNQQHLSRIYLMKKKQIMSLTYLPLQRSHSCPKTHCVAPSSLILVFPSWLSPGLGVWWKPSTRQVHVNRTQRMRLR